MALERVLPYFHEFGLQEPPDPISAETAVFEEAVIEPVGAIDIGYDHVRGDLEMTPTGDLRLVAETPTMAQWIAVAIQVRRGAELIYSPAFGSDIQDLIGTSLPLDAATVELEEAIGEALAEHERIVRIEDFVVVPDGETLHFSGTVVTDQDDRLVFEGNAT